MPALNESWWSNGTSIGSGHPELGGGRGKPSISNDLAASTNLLFSWLSSLCTVLLRLRSLIASLSRFLCPHHSPALLGSSAFSRENEMILVLAYYQWNELSICACQMILIFPLLHHSWFVIFIIIDVYC